MGRAEWRGPQGQERPLEPYLCGLWNRNWSDGSEAKDRTCSAELARLAAPNLLDGLAAALLTHCEADRKKCLVALSVQDGAHMSEGTLRAFAQLAPTFKKCGLLSASWQEPDFKAALKQAVPPMSMSIY